MNITQEQKEYIESIIKECPGYKGNECLLDDFCNEVIKRAYSFVSEQKELDTVKIYLKRIANSAILEVIRNSISSSLNKVEKDDFVIDCEFDENDDIALNYDISFETSQEEDIFLTENQINNIKEFICKSDEDNHFYKNLFEMRYLKGLNNLEIAERLEIKESEVNKKLLFLLGNIKKEVFSNSR